MLNEGLNPENLDKYIIDHKKDRKINLHTNDLVNLKQRHYCI